MALYQFWSEENYAASFMTPSPENVREFREWLSNMENQTRAHKDYEMEFLDEYHKQNKAISF